MSLNLARRVSSAAHATLEARGFAKVLRKRKEGLTPCAFARGNATLFEEGPWIEG